MGSLGGSIPRVEQPDPAKVKAEADAKRARELQSLAEYTALRRSQRMGRDTLVNDPALFIPGVGTP